MRGFPVFAQYDDLDTGAAILRLADGTLGVLSQTRHDPLGYDIRMEIVGSRDAVTVGFGQQDAAALARGRRAGPGRPAWTTFLDRFATAYRDELVTFLRVASGEIPSPCTARDGLEAMRVAVAAGRSRAEHRPVRVADIG